MQVEELGRRSRSVVSPEEMRPSTAGGPYPIPDLFPDARGLSRGALRDYVEGVMSELAGSGRMVLTDLLVQPAGLRDVCGRVLSGEWIDYEEDHVQRMDPGRVPSDIRNYVVRVRLLPKPSPADLTDWKPYGPDTTPEKIQEEIDRRWPTGISWKKGMLPRGQRVFRRDREAMRTDLGGVASVEEVRYSVDRDEADLDVMHAWSCLRQHGRYCKRANRERSRLLGWHYVEVPRCPDCGQFYAVSPERHVCATSARKRKE